MKPYRSYAPLLGLLLTVMLMVSGREVKGQVKTYLKGQKTGNRVQSGSLIGLGVGAAKLSSPMQAEVWGCLLGIQTNEFRFYYGNSAILNDSPVEFTKLTAARSFGLAGLLGSGADIYLQFRNTSNATIPGGTSTYFKLKERPTNTGISLNLGGLLGLVELNSITGTGYTGATNYFLNTATLGVLSCPNPYNGLENAGSVAGISTTKLLIDELGEWYAKVTPDAAYNSVRLNVAFPSGLSLANVAAEINANVYNAFTQTDGNICNARPQFTNAGEAAGITLNTGVLGLDLNQLVANPHYAINGNPTQYSSFSSGVLNLGVASTISQTFYFDHSGNTNDGVSFRMGLPQALIDLALFGNGITFKVYKDETLVNTQTLATNILDLNLLNLISLGPGYKELNVTINPNVVFNKVVVELNAGLLNLGVVSDELRLYDITLTSSKPTFTSPANSQNVTICSGNTATLSAATDAGNELIWYNSLSSTAPLLKNSDGTYTSPALTSNTTYYVASRKIGCTFESERVPVNVTINPLPTATISGNTSVCQNATAPTITFTGSGGTAPYTFTYNINGAAQQTIPTVTGNSVTIPAPTDVAGSFIYNLVSVKDNSSTQCSQNQTGTVTIVVKPTPALTSSLSTSACSNTVFSYIPISSITGTVFTWTRAAVPGISNTAVTIPNSGSINETLINTTTLPIDVKYLYNLTINGCSKEVEVTITVNPIPTLSSTQTPSSICSNTIFDYIPESTTNGVAFTWTRAAVPGLSNPAITNETIGSISETLINTTSLPIIVTYVYYLTKNGCTNTQGVIVTVNPSPSITLGSSPFICQGVTIAPLIYSVPSANPTVYSITWGSLAQTAGLSDVPFLTLPASPINLTIPANIAAGTYSGTLTVKNGNGCISTPINFNLIVHTRPTAPQIITQ